jgi:GT2 family glycosyltransferase/Tfp pilus assembly protein PilF
MPSRYLFGPVTPLFADLNLPQARRERHCLAFDPDGKTDLAISADDTWAKVCARFPSGWKPDFVVLNLPYASIPQCLWSAPIPLVGLALDWRLLWHYYRRCLRSCDLVLTDAVGVEAMSREGIVQARAANLHGCDKSFLELLPKADQSRTDVPAASTPKRDIDILFCGNLNHSVQPERLPWVQRIARLGDRWRVSIRSGIFGEPYQLLLQRARIVFSHVGYPRQSRRHTEAIAAGALLFEHCQIQQALPEFEDRRDCVFYDTDNLEALLEHYLENEEERQAIVASAQAKLPRLGFESRWQETMALIERDWPDLVNRSRHRHQPGKSEALAARLWQAFHAPYRSDRELARDLDSALAAEPQSANFHNAIGSLLPRVCKDPRLGKAVAEVSADHFDQAVAHSPTHVAARLSLVEANVAAGNSQFAIEQARQALGMLQRLPELDPAALDCGQFHFQFDDFRAAWERAAWLNAGNPRAEARVKRRQVRWRLESLLAKLTGDLVHYFDASLNAPVSPTTSAALGCTLASKNYPVEAIAPLEGALAANPFDRDAARALSHMLSVLGDRDAHRRFIEDRRLLSQAAPTIVPPEAWFSDPKPSDRDLASILILCCDEVECTRLCLESVLRHTRHPYELIIVDNGSSDGTPELLQEVRSRPGPVRVDIIRNETNVGFPAGCNQGLARARGRYLALLNNDTVVTPHWLDGLIAWSLHDWPAIGLVGAVCNYAPDAQGIRAGYSSLDDLDTFAAKRREQFRGKFLPVNRLTGFCLLLRREVLERIGQFDERYGIGFFDDDDMGLRAREHGFRLLVALDVYIHHFGSRTFKRLGIDTRKQLLKNFDLFREKWGIEATAGYHLPDAPPAAKEPKADAVDEPVATEPRADAVDEPVAVVEAKALSPAERSNLADSTGTPPAEQPPVSVHNEKPLFSALDLGAERGYDLAPLKQPLVSLCMIVKNEEKRLGACLESVMGLFDELIVVDTGSTDRTKEVATGFGARVEEFPWCNSFGAARNECLRYATGKWIMWLDADDRLDFDNQRKLRELFADLPEELVAYSMRVRSVMDENRTAFRLLDQVRMFPRHPRIRWEYRVHEQTLPALNRLGGRVCWTDIVVDHVGYQDVSARRGKLERNLHLLELDYADHPNDAFTLFNFGWTLMDLGRTQEAFGHLRKSLDRSAPDSSIVRKLYHLLAICHRQLGDKKQARSICREGLAHFPDDTELLLEEALILLDAKEFSAAETDLLQLVETTPAPYFGSADDGVRGFRTRHLLANNYVSQDRASEAEVQLRAAIQERPNFAPAWMALGELYLKQQRWNALAQLTQGLEREGASPLEAAVFRARGHFARKEFSAAQSEIAELLPRFPNALGPRVLLSHILLQEGRDLLAAEQVLREVLKLDAGNTEARHNLSVLLRQLGRSADV